MKFLYYNLQNIIYLYISMNSFQLIKKKKIHMAMKKLIMYLNII